MYDIAAAAGVSVATVSRVLNEQPNVSPKTRERVLALMRASGFRPNANARRLVLGGAGQVCFLLANREVVHSFHSRVLMGVEEYCAQNGQQVVFTTLEYGPGDAFPNGRLPRIIDEHGGMDGLLIAGVNYPCFIDFVEELGIPYVLFGNNLVTGSLALPRKNSVCFHEARGGEHATAFLLELGHRHIVFAGNISHPWYRRRAQGYCAAMAARGTAPAVIDIRDEASADELGRKAIALMVRDHPGATAVLAQDDETACGMLDALRRLGVRVPEDISVVGYDDISEIRYLHPALTTVRVPKERIGAAMADQLLRGARAPVIVPELVIRDSCAKAGPPVKSISAAG